MINAAVPLEAYDSGQTIGTDMLARMTENSWKPYRVDGGEKLFADSWHTLFTDARSNVTWADRFRGVLGTETYNFYSTGEDVVENASDSETARGDAAQQVWDTLTALIGFGETGRHAWVAQEIAKGSDSSFIQIPMGEQHGGWGYNSEYFDWDDLTNPKPLPFGDAMGLSEDALRVTPFFMRFQDEDNLFAYNGAALFAPDQDATAAAEAAKAGTQYKLLAEAIPARSFAAAANAVDELTELFNLDMMTLKNHGRWPVERGAAETKFKWLHSDFRVVSLTYTFPMWNTMITKGALDTCVGC